MTHDPKHPGRFEGESQATVYFYLCGLDGDSDDTFDFGGGFNVDLVEVFSVSKEERKMFGLKENHYAIHHTDSGHVWGCEASRLHLKDIQSDYDRHCADSEESDSI